MTRRLLEDLKARKDLSPDSVAGRLLATRDPATCQPLHDDLVHPEISIIFLAGTVLGVRSFLLWVLVLAVNLALCSSFKIRCSSRCGADEGVSSAGHLPPESICLGLVSEALSWEVHSDMWPLSGPAIWITMPSVAGFAVLLEILQGLRYC